MQAEPSPRKLLDRVSDRIWVNHYSKLTNESYVQYTIEELKAIVGVKQEL